jgi:hypothetical protein
MMSSRLNSGRSPLADDLLQVVPVQQLHRDEGTLGLVNVVDGDDVGMVEWPAACAGSKSA